MFKFVGNVSGWASEKLYGTPVQNAQNELVARFTEVQTQKQVVTEKLKLVHLRRDILAEAQRTGKDSSQGLEEGVSNARKEWDAAVILLIQKRQAQDAAQIKLDRLLNRPNAGMSQPDAKATERLTVEKEFAQYRQDPDTGLVGAGKVRASAAVENHFSGENKDHARSKQAAEIAVETAAISDKNRFSALRKTIGDRLALRVPEGLKGLAVSTPPPSPKPIGPQDPREFERDPELSILQRLPVLFSLKRGFSRHGREDSFLQNPDVAAMRFPDLQEKDSRMKILPGEIMEALRRRKARV